MLLFLADEDHAVGLPDHAAVSQVEDILDWRMRQQEIVIVLRKAVGDAAQHVEEEGIRHVLLGFDVEHEDNRNNAGSAQAKVAGLTVDGISVFVGQRA